jgi:hypothetical protein
MGLQEGGTVSGVAERAVDEDAIVQGSETFENLGKKDGDVGRGGSLCRLQTAPFRQWGIRFVIPSEEEWVI